MQVIYRKQPDTWKVYIDPKQNLVEFDDYSEASRIAELLVRLGADEARVLHGCLIVEHWRPDRSKGTARKSMRSD